MVRDSRADDVPAVGTISDALPQKIKAQFCTKNERDEISAASLCLHGENVSVICTSQCAGGKKLCSITLVRRNSNSNAASEKYFDPSPETSHASAMFTSVAVWPICNQAPAKPGSFVEGPPQRPVFGAKDARKYVHARKKRRISSINIWWNHTPMVA